MAELGTDLADARNTLLAVPSMAGGESEACTDLLVPPESSQASVLWVTFRRDPTACLDQWLDATGDPPREAAVIVVGEGADSAPDDVTVESIPNPNDLTGLGIQIGQLLSEWDGEVVVCFDSLTAMLQYVDAETAYEFLHAITGQFYAADARAHFHIDPSAHDERTVAAITSLFDAVVTLDGGDAQVRKRQLIR
jgi:hypothetical protein